MRCSFGDIIIKPDGVNELDPCNFVEVEKHTHCVVTVLKCKRCGRIELEWERTEDTEDIDTGLNAG